jgi:fumarate reductase subunit C
MPRPAHPHAMQPARPGRTRTAPPQMPDQFPFRGRYRAYTLFDLTGAVYLLMGFAVLRAVWALGSGSEPWEALLASFRSPVWIAFHGIALVSVCFVGVRFFRLFPKSQPPRIGPVKPPPMPVIYALLYAVWAGVTVLFLLIVGGAIFE